MTYPGQGRPEQSVYPGGGYQVSGSYDALVQSIQALQQAIQTQVSFMERQANASARYSAATVQSMPQVNETVLQGIAQAGGMTSGMSGQTTLMTGMGALSSLQGLQQYTAQRIGAWTAGMPLVTSSGGGGMFTAAGGGGGPSAGSTPVGTPSSASAPAGAGAQAYNAAQASAAAQRAAALQALGGTPSAPPGGLASQAPPPTSAGAVGAGVSSRPPVMQLLGARLAMSGGTSSGILGAVKGLPGVGLAADLYSKATNLYQGQFEAGRLFQEQEGGTNLGGQAERAHQALYEASMAFSPLGTSGAAEAFQGVTQLGYNQASAGFQTTSGAGLNTSYSQSRQGALNFIYNQFTQAGAPIQETLQELEIASENSTVSLGNLNTIIKNLSDTAGQAGDNADKMRQSFMDAFQAAMTGGAGPAAPGLAGAVTSTQASYGQAFAGTSFAGELTQGRQYMLAGTYGLTPGQAGYIQRTAPRQYLNMISGQNLSFIQQLPGMTSQAMSDLQQRITQAGGAAGLKKNPDLVNQIANDWLNQWQASNDIVTSVWAQILSSLLGIPLNGNNVVQFVIQQVAGNNEASAGTQMPQGGTSGAAPVSASNTKGAAKGQFGLAQDTSSSGTGTSGVASRLTGSAIPGEGWQQVLTSHAGAAAQAYLSEESRTKKRSPVLEALLQNVGANQQVSVRTKNGPRVMSFTDAMKYYPDELMSGTAMFFNKSGNQLLGSTAEITQGLVSPEASGVAAEERSAVGSHSGQSLRQYQKAHHVTNGRGMTIDLSAEAKQLLKVLPSNNDQAAAQGTVPSVPWPSQSSR